MIKILIADDHKLMRDGLKKILHEEPDMLVVAEARNGDEAIECVKTHDLDLVLLDISMPGTSGLEVLTTIKRLKPQLPVLMISMHAEARFATRATALGAAGYLTKDSAADELVGAIRKIFAAAP